MLQENYNKMANKIALKESDDLKLLKKYGIKELKDGLTLDMIKEKYPWVLKAKIKDAVLGDGKPGFIWYSGTWKDGVWERGTWKTGTWLNGTWEFGAWLNGIWKDGYFESGSWVDGVWQDGIWRSGFFTGGTWKDGLWKDGTWVGANWLSGNWLNGVWKKGKIKGKDSQVSPKEAEKSKPKDTRSQQELRVEFKKLAEKLNFAKLMDKYLPSHVESIPDLDDYLDEWEGQKFDPDMLEPGELKKDIIQYAKNYN